jgi:hypothetical protein
MINELPINQLRFMCLDMAIRAAGAIGLSMDDLLANARKIEVYLIEGVVSVVVRPAPTIVKFPDAS